MTTCSKCGHEADSFAFCPKCGTKAQGKAPTIRRLKNAGGIPTKELYALFPGGPLKKASKIAGLLKPASCI